MLGKKLKTELPVILLLLNKSMVRPHFECCVASPKKDIVESEKVQERDMIKGIPFFVSRKGEPEDGRLMEVYKILHVMQKWIEKFFSLSLIRLELVDIL